MLAAWLGLDRLQLGFYVSLGVGAFAFILSSFTKNYSFIDRAWSIVPSIYSWIYSTTSNPRTIVMSSLITLWSIRLTHNFVRKGGYKPGEQDYRWPILQTVITNPVLWCIFNLGFISFYQSVLLMLLPIPTYICSLTNEPWRWVDTVAVLLFLVFLGGEAIADNQQWAFQSKKYKLLQTKSLSELPKPYNIGFCTTGLFAYSRHPNFFCENMIWWSLCLFSSKPSWVLVSGCGLLSTTIFIGSTILTEDITSKKYPQYKKYQEAVCCFVPWFPKSIDWKKNE